MVPIFCFNYNYFEALHLSNLVIKLLLYCVQCRYLTVILLTVIHTILVEISLFPCKVYLPTSQLRLFRARMAMQLSRVHIAIDQVHVAVYAAITCACTYNVHTVVRTRTVT